MTFSHKSMVAEKYFCTILLTPFLDPWLQLEGFNFPGIGSSIFSEPWHAVRGPYVTSRFFGKNSYRAIIVKNGSKI